jgi:hypothetical protein
MITERDKEIVGKIKKYLDKQAIIDEFEIDWEKIEWITTLDRLVNNLTIAPYSFKNCSPEDNEERYYTAECDNCGWWGSSKYLDGGGAIADTGDHFDCYCPVCGNVDINEKD